MGSLNVINDSLAAIDIAEDAIRNSELADDAVGSANVINDSLTGADIGQFAIGVSELAPNSVRSDKIVDDSIYQNDIAPNAVASSELAPNAVQSEHVENESLLAEDIAPGAIGNSELAEGSVTAGKIALRQVLNTNIGLRQIDIGHIDSTTLVNSTEGLMLANTDSTFPTTLAITNYIEATSQGLIDNGCNPGAFIQRIDGDGTIDCRLPTVGRVTIGVGGMIVPDYLSCKRACPTGTQSM